MMRQHRFGFLMGVILAAACLGCEQVEDLVGGDDTAAQSAVDSVALSTTESALLALSVEGSTPTMTVEEITDAAIPKILASFQPSTCVTAEKTAVPGTINLTLTDCTGPYGLVAVNGKAVVVYAVTALGVKATLTATDLKANDATVTINAIGDFTTEGEDNTLAITTNGAGTTKRGQLLTRSGAFNFTWNGATDCFKLTGSWATTVESESLDTEAEGWSTTVKDYGRCPAKCPDSGGSIVYAGTGPAGVTITVNFDGSNSAGYLTARGAAGSIPLSCQ